MRQFINVVGTILLLSSVAFAADPVPAKDSGPEQQLAALEKETLQKAGQEIEAVMKKYKVKFSIKYLLSDKGNQPLVQLERLQEPN